jgi:hypothetical protein
VHVQGLRQHTVADCCRKRGHSNSAHGCRQCDIYVCPCMCAMHVCLTRQHAGIMRACACWRGDMRLRFKHITSQQGSPGHAFITVQYVKSLRGNWERPVPLCSRKQCRATAFKHKKGSPHHHTHTSKANSNPWVLKEQDRSATTCKQEGAETAKGKDMSLKCLGRPKPWGFISHREVHAEGSLWMRGATGQVSPQSRCCSRQICMPHPACGLRPHATSGSQMSTA